jgi:prepilin-type N-terminal cleavage/methylation domain-containing protein
MKKNNRGFSLVELVVVVAILAVVGVAVMGFLTTSSNLFKHVSTDVDLQEEAQITMNQLENLLINAEAGVNYTANELCIYNTDSRYVITWDDTKNVLNYRKEMRTSDGSGGYLLTFDSATDALMSEYVKSFVVTTSSSGSMTIVNVALGMEKGDKTYSTNQNFSLRNSVVINPGDISSIYGGTPVAGGTSSVTGITVTLGGHTYTNDPTDTYDVFLQGSDISTTFEVKVLGEGSPSQEYACAVLGSSTDPATGTRVDGGNFIVSKDETSSVLTLNVISKVNLSVASSVTVNVKGLLGINAEKGSSASFESGSTVSVGSGSEAGLIVTPVVLGDTSLYGDSDLGYTVTAGSNCTVSGNTITISNDASVVGENFTVSITSTKDSSITKDFSAPIEAVKTKYINLKCDTGSAERGGTYTVYAVDQTTGEKYDSSLLNWSCSVSSGGKGVSISNGTLSLSSSNSDLGYNSDYTITVTATLKDSSAKADISGIDITVPVVGVSYAESAAGTYSSTITVKVSGQPNSNSTSSIYYKITGLASGSVGKIACYQNGQSATNYNNKVSVDSNSSKITFKSPWNNTITGYPVVNGVELKTYAITIKKK